jgi:hypothetical protein
MQHNVGTVDKVIRVIVGLLAIAGGILLQGVWLYVLVIFGVAMFVTAFIGFCGLYTLMGWNTQQAKSAPETPPKKA